MYKIKKLHIKIKLTNLYIANNSITQVKWNNNNDQKQHQIEIQIPVKISRAETVIRY